MFPRERDTIHGLGFRRENKNELNSVTATVVYGVRMLHCPERPGCNSKFSEAAPGSLNDCFILYDKFAGYLPEASSVKPSISFFLRGVKQ
jgi:hypothetical protein